MQKNHTNDKIKQMIDIYLLQNLVTFAELGTLLKTAEALNVSQSALTRSMQKLEDELGVKIFNRAKNKITLNENGLATVKYAKKILSLQNEMLNTLQQMDKATHEITFGSIAPAPIFELNPILKNAYPGVKINSVLKNDEKELFEGLKTDQYNFIISRIPLNDGEHFCREYFKEGLKIFLPENHRLAGKKSIYLKDLAGETFLMLSELGFWAEIKKAKIPDAKFITQEEAENLKELIESSNLPTFVTDIAQNSQNYPTYTQKDRVAIPILDKEVNVTFYIVMKKESYGRFSELFKNL